MSDRLVGLPGAPGIALGPLARLDAEHGDGGVATAPSEPEVALTHFEAARTRVAGDLEALGAELRAEGKTDEAAIFDAQALLATDPALTAEVRRLVEAGTGLDVAVARATETLAATLAALDDSYLRERAADVEAVGAQLGAVLRGATGAALAAIPPGAIVVARDLTPAETAQLRRQRVAGFATAGGTPTGHVAILARALGLPAAVGLGEALLAAPDGASAILSGDEGLLLVAPTAAEQAEYSARAAAGRAVAARRGALVDLPATTRDGHRVALWANLGRPEEARAAVEQGAEGVGLFRTEFLFLDRAAPPDEAEQYAAYAEVLRLLAGRPLIVRTLDVGGDKPIPYLPRLVEANPFLGTRGIRFTRRFPELFDTQARALLRAAVLGDLRIMLPLVAIPDDVVWARRRLAGCAEALAREGLPHRADVPLGIMVETPAAALTLDRLAVGGPASFCSIGSNDLAQYALAADRGEPELARRYRHDDPAVLRLIREAVAAAQRLGLEMSLCGELAGEPHASIILVGLGLDKLSMAPTALPVVKEALRATTLAEAGRAAATACGVSAPDGLQPPSAR